MNREASAPLESAILGSSFVRIRNRVGRRTPGRGGRYFLIDIDPILPGDGEESLCDGVLVDASTKAGVCDDRDLFSNEGGQAEVGAQPCQGGGADVRLPQEGGEHPCDRSLPGPFRADYEKDFLVARLPGEEIPEHLLQRVPCLQIVVPEVVEEQMPCFRLPAVRTVLVGERVVREESGSVGTKFSGREMKKSVPAGKDFIGGEPQSFADPGGR